MDWLVDCRLRRRRSVLGGACQADGRAKREEFLEKNFGRLPVALHVDVASPLKLTAFIVALRGMVEQTAPGMVVWESLTYHD